jgi:hypothetical protein
MIVISPEGGTTMTTVDFEPLTVVVPLWEDPPGVFRVGKSRVLLELGDFSAITTAPRRPPHPDPLPVGAKANGAHRRAGFPARSRREPSLLPAGEKVPAGRMRGRFPARRGRSPNQSRWRSARSVFFARRDKVSVTLNAEMSKRFLAPDPPKSSRPDSFSASMDEESQTFLPSILVDKDVRFHSPL